MLRDNRHDNAYVFGAICPARGVGAAMITPAANTECMNLHLAELSTQVSTNAIAVVLCDGAGRHQTGGELQVPDNIVLLHLPPFAPELNAMENVWAYLHTAKLCARAWNTYDEIVEARRQARLFLTNDPNRIRSIGTREWATVTP